MGFAERHSDALKRMIMQNPFVTNDSDYSPFACVSGSVQGLCNNPIPSHCPPVEIRSNDGSAIPRKLLEARLAARGGRAGAVLGTMITYANLRPYEIMRLAEEWEIITGVFIINDITKRPSEIARLTLLSAAGRYVFEQAWTGQA